MRSSSPDDTPRPAHFGYSTPRSLEAVRYVLVGALRCSVTGPARQAIKLSVANVVLRPACFHGSRTLND